MADFYRQVYGGMAEGTLEVQKRASNQRGNGFFGRIIKGSLAPIIRSVLPYLKDLALDGVGGLVSDLKEGMNMKDAAKSQLKRSASTVAEDMASTIKRKFAQTGSGIRKKQKGSGLSKKRRRQGRKRGAKSKVKTTARPKQRGLFPI